MGALVENPRTALGGSQSLCRILVQHLLSQNLLPWALGVGCRAQMQRWSFLSCIGALCMLPLHACGWVIEFLGRFIECLDALDDKWDGLGRSEAEGLLGEERFR